MAETSYEALHILGLTAISTKTTEDAAKTALKVANDAVIAAADAVIALSNGTTIAAEVAAKATLVTAQATADAAETAFNAATLAITNAITNVGTGILHAQEKNPSNWVATNAAGTVTATNSKTGRTFTGTMDQYNTLIASL